MSITANSVQCVVNINPRTDEVRIRCAHPPRGQGFIIRRYAVLDIPAFSGIVVYCDENSET